jgi:hypothetical protein
MVISLNSGEPTALPLAGRGLAAYSGTNAAHSTHAQLKKLYLAIPYFCYPPIGRLSYFLWQKQIAKLL